MNIANIPRFIKEFLKDKQKFYEDRWVKFDPYPLVLEEESQKKVGEINKKIFAYWYNLYKDLVDKYFICDDGSRKIVDSENLPKEAIETISFLDNLFENLPIGNVRPINSMTRYKITGTDEKTWATLVNVISYNKKFILKFIPKVYYFPKWVVSPMFWWYVINYRWDFRSYTKDKGFLWWYEFNPDDKLNSTDYRDFVFKVILEEWELSHLYKDIKAISVDGSGVVSITLPARKFRYLDLPSATKSASIDTETVKPTFTIIIEVENE